MEELIDLLKVDDYNYFCHFTKIRPEIILNSELRLKESKWYTTMLELSDTERENIWKFLKEERGIKRADEFRNYAVLIAVPSELGYDFINQDDDLDMPYYVSNEHLLCVVDIERKDVLYNESSIIMEDAVFR